MSNKLQLSPAATVTANAQGLLLQSDLGAFQLHGKDISEFITQIMPLLNGEHDEQAICDRLPHYDATSIKTALKILVERGLLEIKNESNKERPPWPLHERFLKAWPSPAKKTSNDLANMHVLVLGLSPWSVTMVEELAISGVGHLHLLDNKALNEDDILCCRKLDQQHLGEPRAATLIHRLKDDVPWCQFSSEALNIDANGELLLEDHSSWDLVVVAFSNEEMYWLEKASKYTHKAKLRTLYTCLDGLESCLGPVVIPDETACWQCLRLRRLGAASSPQIAHELEKGADKNTSRARSMLISMAALTGHQSAMEVLKLLLQYTPSNLSNSVFIQNLVTHESTRHAFIAMPWCDVCGGAEHISRVKTPTIADAAPTDVAMSAAAGYSPEKNNPLNSLKTIDQLKDLLEGWIGPVTGVVRQLSGHTPQLPDFPVTASAGLSTFTAGNYDPRGMGQVGSGKGLDELSAHISAFGEAIERYSAARYKTSRLTYASIAQLNIDAVNPETLVLYSKKQYHSPNFPFSAWKRKQKIHWVKGTWLGTQKTVWVPALVSYFNFSVPFEEQFSQVSSNGLAAGQTNEDAGIRACYELIERDAMMLTWYAQHPCQRLHLDSQRKGKMAVMIDELTERGVELELYLLNVGIDVATVVCLAMGDGQTTPAVSVALATHGDIHVAMRKALLEQGHVLPYLCHLMSNSHTKPKTVAEVQSLEDHAAYYFSNDKQSAFDFMRQSVSQAVHVEQLGYKTVNGVDDLRQRLVSAGVDVAIVDVTSPDVALSPFRVARAVGVNMQPIHFGEQFKRVDNPRLRKLLKGAPVNMNPHPIA